MIRINKMIKMAYLLYRLGVISKEEFQHFEQIDQKKRDCAP